MRIARGSTRGSRASRGQLARDRGLAGAGPGDRPRPGRGGSERRAGLQREEAEAEDAAEAPAPRAGAGCHWLSERDTSSEAEVLAAFREAESAAGLGDPSSSSTTPPSAPTGRRRRPALETWDETPART